MSSSRTSVIFTTTTTAPVRPTRSSKRTYLPLSDAIALTGKLFNPNLRSWRPFRVPVVPSLRASQLPPPCAELDERPKRRVRRFMLWQDKVPPLRLVVLDPRKRVHLRRFNAFQIPSNPQPSRGIRTWSGNLTSHKIQPPIQPIPRTLDRAPTDRPIRAVTPTGVVLAQAGGVIAPIATIPLIAPTTKHDLVSGNSSSTSAPLTPRLPAVRVGPSVPSVPAALRLPAAMGARVVPRVRSTTESRCRERAKLLQHLFVLEQQAERRWRMAMDYMVTKMLVFEEEHTAPSTTNDKPIWTTKPDPAVVIQWLEFMSDIRTWGNVWPHLELAQRDLPESQKIKPVKGLTQARQKVREADRKREENKRVKIAKIKAMREAKAAAIAGSVESGFVGPISRGVGPNLVIPRKASPVLRVVDPIPAPVSLQRQLRGTQARSSGSESAHSERIVTPPASVAELPKSHASPIIDTTPDKLREMGLNAEIPDDIAHHLAEMLTRFQAIGLDRAQKAKEVIPETSVRISAAKAEGGRRRRKTRHKQDLEVSIESDSSGSDFNDAITIDPFSKKGSEVGSWMTGDLNMDEDTRAMMSGVGTDTGSAP